MKNVILFVFLLILSIRGICQSVDNELCGESDEIRTYLIENGYYPLIEIDSIIGKYEEEKDLKKIEDYTRFIVSYQGRDTTIADLIKRDIEGALNEGLFVKGFITENKSFCDDQLFKKIRNGFNTEDLDCAIYVHIWESDVLDQKCTVFMKIKETTWDVLRRNHPVSRIDSLTRYFKLEAAEIYPKKRYLSEFRFLPLEQWKEGMRFLVDNNDCVTGRNTYFHHYQDSESKIDIKENIGEIFTFKRHEEREVKIRGISYILLLLIFEKEGQEYEYADRYVDLDLDKFRNIKNLVYIDELEVLKNELLGKYLYLLVDFAEEYNSEGEKVSNFSYDYPGSKLDKFSKVKVEEIEYGIQNGPAKIWFTVEGKKNRFCHYVSLSRINGRNSCGSGKMFDEVFMLEDPRLYYSFSEKKWTMIINREIEVGMNMDAIRLSQGTPFGAMKSVTENEQYQIWNYGSHKILFENNIVIEIE